MAKKATEKKAAGYLAHCPDCITLPKAFPTTCFKELLAAARDVLAGRAPADPQCAVHCAYTFVGYGLSFWIDEDHPHPEPLVFDTSFDARVAIEELEGYLPEGVEAGVKMKAGAVKELKSEAKAIPWTMVLQLAMWLLERLLPKPK